MLSPFVIRLTDYILYNSHHLFLVVVLFIFFCFSDLCEFGGMGRDEGNEGEERRDILYWDAFF